jgi:hypothetical protein
LKFFYLLPFELKSRHLASLSFAIKSLPKLRKFSSVDFALDAALSTHSANRQYSNLEKNNEGYDKGRRSPIDYRFHFTRIKKDGAGSQIQLPAHSL